MVINSSDRRASDDSPEEGSITFVGFDQSSMIAAAQSCADLGIKANFVDTQPETRFVTLQSTDKRITLKDIPMHMVVDTIKAYSVLGQTFEIISQSTKPIEGTQQETRRKTRKNMKRG